MNDSPLDGLLVPDHSGTIVVFVPLLLVITLQSLYLKAELLAAFGTFFFIDQSSDLALGVHFVLIHFVIAHFVHFSL